MTTTAQQIAEDHLRARFRFLEAIVRDNVVEVKNSIGGVIGYRLELDVTDTRRVWDVLMREGHQP